MEIRKFFIALALLPFIIGILYYPSITFAQIDPGQDTPTQKAIQLLEVMTPSEKVGQLFLVSFNGTDTSVNSKIFDLIINYHIGGVILSAKNDNFVGPEDTISDLLTLNNSLQEVEWSSAHPENLVETNIQIQRSNYIPLFIATSQEGDGAPYSQILSNVTQIPSLMAIGATWSPELALGVGEIQGKELSALGINMLFGPSLDVLDLTFSKGNEGLGIRSFGSNPYWVGKLGAAYIEGLNVGSDNKIAVIAKHFPGRGSSDRNPDLEVGTVRKSYDVLLETDLAPFLAVTSGANYADSITDGLQLSNVRYEGLQGLIRNSTRPIGFDATALEQLFTIQSLADWHNGGGIIVSNNLGSEAVRKYFDPNGVLFDARQIARNVLNAGVDLLVLDNFISSGSVDQYATIIRTHEFILQKYQEDEAFAQRVDLAVQRLLTKKFEIYPEFELINVISPQVALENVGQNNPMIFEVAQSSVTLLNPSLNEYSNTLPRPPGLSDRTLFFTDLRLYRQCSTCPEIEMLPTDALRREVVRLYGPQAGGDIAQYLLSTFSFMDLIDFLNGVEGSELVGEELRAADWVVFSMLETDPNYPASMALKRLLSEHPELIADKYTIAFSFNAPYVLDATEISRLSAYFGIYSKIPSFTEIAVRVLFQEIVPQGSLPISMPSIGYDIEKATSPDPSQTIPIRFDPSSPVYSNPEIIAPSTEGTGQPTPIPSFYTGDTLPLMTGVIYDHNGNIVPDGTNVRFIFTLEGEVNSIQQIDTATIEGIARAEYLIQNEGRLEIRVTSEDALLSDKLALNIIEGQAAVITVILPTPTSTNTPSPTATVITPTFSPTITPTPIPHVPAKTSGSDWIFSMVIIWGLSMGIFLVGRGVYSIRWGLRWGFLSAIGGLVAYIFMSINSSTNQAILENAGLWGLSLAIVIGMLIGWTIGWLWRGSIQSRRHGKRSN